MAMEKWLRSIQESKGDDMKYLLEKPIEKMTEDEFAMIIGKTPIPEKQIVLSYLRSYPWCSFTSEPGRDRITSQKICEADNARTDGEYRWYESEIYHFEKYNLRLNDDFIKHILAKS